MGGLVRCDCAPLTSTVSFAIAVSAVSAEFVVMGGPFQEKRAIGLSGTVGERFGDDGIAITARVIAEHLALHHREAAIGGVGDGLVAGEAD